MTSPEPLEPKTLEVLEQIARAATPGPWNQSRTQRYVKEGVGAPWVCELDCTNKAWEANSAFIATFDPPTVLRLLSRVRELEEALKPFGKAADLIRADQEDFKLVAYVPAGADFKAMNAHLTAGNFRAARQALELSK